jgi:hypothetical protein
MKKIVKLTESDLTRIVKRVVNEQSETDQSSKFDKMSDASLLKYLKYFNNIMGDISRDLQEFSSDLIYNKTKFAAASAPIGELSRLDVEYLFYVLTNSDLSTGKLVRPELTEKTVYWVVKERIITTITRATDITTYADDYIDEGYLNDLKGNGDIEPLDWDVDSDDNDSDILDDYFEL